MNFSEKQLDIFETWKTNNLLISAVPGSGKTTTLIEILKRCKWQTLFLAFNNSIQQEINSRIEKLGLVQGKAMTLHSLGKRSLPRHRVVKNKHFDLFKELKSSKKWKRYFYKLDYPEQLAISFSLSDLNDSSRRNFENDFKSLLPYLNSMGKVIADNEYLEEMWEDFKVVRDKSYTLDIIPVDFLDMIYLPVLNKYTIPFSPTYLLIDECQDLNSCQHTLIKQFINQGSIERFAAVGDKRQSIYGFSGSNSKSFDLFKEYDNIVEKPLDICYRSDKKIIKSANEVYNVMEGFSDKEGIVEKCTDISDIKLGSMIICRNSNPLIDLYFKLLSVGKPVYIEGDDILSSIRKFLSPYKKDSLSLAFRKLSIEQEKLSKSTTEQGKIKYYFFDQNLKNFYRLYQGSQISELDTVEVLLNKIQSFFIEEKDAIKLCTIHKSKGLEENVVYILNENLIPSKFAKTTEQLIQEKNLKFVARSRAKHEMYFLNI